MKIEESAVSKIMITGVEGLDPIAVMTENFGPGQGKITITCFGEAWSHYWSHMGEKTTLEDFFLQASRDYLICKLKAGIRDEIDDDDDEALETLLKRKIIKMRREKDTSHEQARDWWNQATNIAWDDRYYICSEILGEEWWYCTPKKPNPDYLYLGKIVDTIKEAFKQMKVARVVA